MSVSDLLHQTWPEEHITDVMPDLQAQLRISLDICRRTNFLVARRACIAWRVTVRKGLDVPAPTYQPALFLRHAVLHPFAQPFGSRELGVKALAAHRRKHRRSKCAP